MKIYWVSYCFLFLLIIMCLTKNDTVIVYQHIVSDTIVVVDTVYKKPSYEDVTATTYNPCPEQGWGDGTITYDGSKIDLQKLEKGHIQWVAISHDLLSKYPMGSLIYIQGHGIYEVHDLMNKRFTNRIDILQSKNKKGFRKRLKILKL